MTDLVFPFPVSEVENGVLLYYFVYDPNWANKKIDKIKYQFVSYDGKDYCLFNDIWAVPMEIFERLFERPDLKTQKFLYFMKYNFTSIYSELFFTFEIDEEFIVNYKAYKTFLEYRKTLESEKKLNDQENLKENEESVEEKAEKIEKNKNAVEEAKALLN
jgi:hypothetical protein